MVYWETSDKEIGSGDSKILKKMCHYVWADVFTTVIEILPFLTLNRNLKHFKIKKTLNQN